MQVNLFFFLPPTEKFSYLNRHLEIGFLERNMVCVFLITAKGTYTPFNRKQYKAIQRISLQLMAVGSEPGNTLTWKLAGPKEKEFIQFLCQSNPK